MIKKILVPIEFSYETENVVSYASHIAKQFNAKMLLLHVYNIPQYEPYAVSGPAGAPPADHYMQKSLMEEEKRMAHQKADELVNRVRELKEVKHEVMTKPGFLTDEINDIAQEELVDLVIMGTSGASGLKEFFMGTHGEKVTRKVPCSVILVPQDYSFKNIKNICLAIDSERTSDNIIQLNIIKSLAKIFDSTIHVINVKEETESSDDKDMFEGVKQELSGAKMTFSSILNDSIEEGVKEFMDTKPIDLVSLIFHEHSFFERIINPSLVSKMAYHTDIPLLVIK